MKLSRMASASGMRISLPTYRAATTRAMPAIIAVGETDVAAGFLVTACRHELGGGGLAMGS
jgi:hypothetical protein